MSQDPLHSQLPPAPTLSGDAALLRLVRLLAKQAAREALEAAVEQTEQDDEVSED